VSPLGVGGFCSARALSHRNDDPATASRPWDVDRDGFVLGEGAGILVLEERDRAIARGARILAEVAGFGQTCDAGHLTDPDETGAGPARAVRLALEDAGLGPSDIGYVNAHATSTPAGDIAELRALAAAGLSGVPISSTKALHGHALGAAGGIEAVAALMALVRGVLPGGGNLDDPETDPPADLITSPRRADVDAVVSNSFGFGGHNAAVVFRRG
jgi:3-oxoacyl-[acyl-carrier-protein] synthase II